MMLVLLLLMLLFVIVIVEIAIGIAATTAQTIFVVAAVAAKTTVHLQLLLGMLRTYSETTTQALRKQKETTMQVNTYINQFKTKLFHLVNKQTNK